MCWKTSIFCREISYLPFVFETKVSYWVREKSTYSIFGWGDARINVYFHSLILLCLFNYNVSPAMWCNVVLLMSCKHHCNWKQQSASKKVDLHPRRSATRSDAWIHKDTFVEPGNAEHKLALAVTTLEFWKSCRHSSVLIVIFHNLEKEKKDRSNRVSKFRRISWCVLTAGSCCSKAD